MKPGEVQPFHVKRSGAVNPVLEPLTRYAKSDNRLEGVLRED